MNRPDNKKYFTQRIFKAQSLLFIVLLFCFISQLYPSSLAAQQEENPNSLALTDDEKDWLTAHPEIKVGVDPAWPPYDFIDKNSKHQGLSADLLQLLGKRLGISFNYTPDLTWKQALEGIKQGTIDIASICAITPERSKFMLFTKPIAKPQWVIATRTDFKHIENLKDLIYDRVIMAEGYAIIEHSTLKHPDLSIIEAKTPQDGLKAVSTGQADAYVGYLGSITYLIRENDLANMKIAAEAGFPKKFMHIGVRSDWPELIPLLNKALKSISKNEMEAIVQKWLPIKLDEHEHHKDESWKAAFWWIGGSFVAFLILALLMFIYVKASHEETLINRFGSPGFQRSVILILVLFLFTIAILLWRVLEFNKQVILEEHKTALEVVLNTTAERLNLWINERKKLLTQFSHERDLLHITEQLLVVPPTSESLMASEALAKSRSFFKNHIDLFGDNDFFIINPDLINIGSSRDANLGERNFIASQNATLIKRVFQGETIFVPPLESDITLNSDEIDNEDIISTMFFAAPIRNMSGTIIAILAQRLDPTLEFSQVFNFGQIGKTGETYAFSISGKLLSESRFNKQLHQIGLTTTQQKSIISIDIRDPGGNLLAGYEPKIPRSKQPLTRMATSAVRGESDVDMFGYRDYRGVPVFGAWLWNNEHNIGIATEQNILEVMHSYNLMRWTIFGIIGITLIFSIGGIFLTLFLGQQANITLRRSRDELEERVIERTAELEESEIKFRTLIETTSDAYLLLTDVFIECNEAACRMWNTSREEIIGSTLIDFSPEHQPDGQSSIEKAKMYIENATKGSPQSFYWQHMTKDGKLIDEELTLKAIDYKGRRVLLTIVRDITERKKAEEELQQLSQAVRQSPVSVVITDKNGNIEYVNPWFEEVTGYRFEEVVGQNPRVLSSGKQDKAFYKEMWNTILSGKAWHGEFCNCKKNGDIYWESASISSIKGSNGEITRFVAVKEDVTDKKSMEIAIIKAKETAEAATKAKSNFLANMSHEIRTPMNAVIGMTHLALETELTPRQQNYLQKISMATKTLLSIINDILDFSKIEAGKLDIEQAKFNLTNLLEDVVALSIDKIAKNGVELLFYIDDKIPNVLIGDEVRVSQIFNNLLSNATKFTEKGEIKVSARLTERLDNKIIIECSVKDTGIGLTREQQKRLFQKFNQADTSTTRKYGGTGLGLSISKQLVELMGGNIWVESEQGKGSTFTFTLILGEGKDRRKIEKQSLPLNLRNLEVLIIEENKSVREQLSQALKAFSFKVVTTSSCDNALQLYQEAIDSRTPFELIFSNWNTQKNYQGKICTTIDNNSDVTRPPIIFMTSVREEMETAAYIQTRDMTSLLVKPVTPSDVYNAIVDAFGYSELRIKSRRAISSGNMKNLQVIQGAKILLTEDNEINRMVAGEILEKAGIIVTFAENGLQAIESVKESEFELIFMDIQMPEMDGLTATREIRKLGYSIEKLPIVAMTAHAMTGDREKSLKAGMNDHLNKPIDPKELYSCLLRWIKPGNRLMVKNISSKETHVDKGNKHLGLPVDIPGISTSYGLRHTMGNIELYKEVLIDFYSDYMDSTMVIEKALQDGEHDSARRLIHTIKGLAGTIGAGKLQSAAAKLEGAVTKEEQNPYHLFHAFNKELKRVLEGIKQFTAVKDVATTIKKLDTGNPEKLAMLLGDMEPYLLKHIPKESKEIINKILEYEWNKETNKELKTLTRLLDKYKFDDAHILLKSILKKI
ncbi:MAG: PAS domain S-box protein [Desulfobulbaceae bacterium]|nr:PAS domain S-box protein [Desulfobulbaceae bacterium]